MQGYNPDWSGLLGATQQRGQVLGGIGQALGGMAKQSRLEEEQAQQKQLMQSEIQGAMQSNDPNQIAQVSLKYPKMSTAIKDAFGFTSGETEKNFKDTNFKILSNPESAPQYLQERVDYLDSIGADSSAPKARLQMQQDNPKQFIETTRGLTSAAYPTEFTSWSGAMMDDKEKAQPFQQGSGAMSGYAFNPEDGSFSIDPTVKQSLTESATKKAANAASTPKGELTFKDISGLNKEITPLIKGTKDIYSAAKSLAKLKESSSPTDQLAAIFKFMKANDPTSVVREGEQQMAKRTGGPMDAFVGFVNQIQGEGGLSPEAFGNMVETSRNMANSAIDVSIGEIDNYLDVYGDTINDTIKTKVRNRVPEAIKRAVKAKAKGAPLKSYTSTSGMQFTVEE